MLGSYLQGFFCSINFFKTGTGTVPIEFWQLLFKFNPAKSYNPNYFYSKLEAYTIHVFNMQTKGQIAMAFSIYSKLILCSQANTGLVLLGGH